MYHQPLRDMSRDSRAASEPVTCDGLTIEALPRKRTSLVVPKLPTSATREETEEGNEMPGSGQEAAHILSDEQAGQASCPTSRTCIAASFIDRLTIGAGLSARPVAALTWQPSNGRSCSVLFAVTLAENPSRNMLISDRPGLKTIRAAEVELLHDAFSTSVCIVQSLLTVCSRLSWLRKDCTCKRVL
ncbi:hypothetical protein N657DRAFT_481388 [Parathielavia appendiculata]|uniref:Uncharacterized protein n=1 Tax=Parathielavia appendiculata TaxID=2587402 RepID=A0AAN6TZ56_9PEZI|nr:hypothetical protein N657DRAFT_481388 [Parathielavia appendiculata]